jgi:hypothetical protein
MRLVAGMRRVVAEERHSQDQQVTHQEASPDQDIHLLVVLDLDVLGWSEIRSDIHRLL